MDFEHARHNMIEQQVRPWDVLDQRVLDVLGSLPREDFVAPEYRALAYSDTRIPIGHGEVMLNPSLDGRLLQALALAPDDRVLEVGTGSGYLSACLAKLAGEVHSVEIHPDLSASAAERLHRQGLRNLQLHVGDAAGGWRDAGPWDAIALTGAVPEIPPAYRSALAIGGRLFAVVGDPAQPIMEAVLVTRASEDDWSGDSLFETVLPPLHNTTRAPVFVF